MTVDQYSTALKNHHYARAYLFLKMSLPTSLLLEQSTQMAKAREAAEGTMSTSGIAPDLAGATKSLLGEPLPLVTFSGKPAETLIVQVIRANGTAYPVRLQV